MASWSCLLGCLLLGAHFALQILRVATATTHRHHPPPRKKHDFWGSSDRQRSIRTEELLTQLENFEIVVPTRVDSRGSFVTFDVMDDDVTRTQRETDWSQGHGSTARGERHVGRQSRDLQAMFALQQLEYKRWIYYKLRAYGSDFHFNLTLNRKLVSPQYRVEFWGRDGVLQQEQRSSRDCHYTGVISNMRLSRAAISNCYGLHGVFATSNEEYFVEPLWNFTSNVDEEGHQHVVYKRSAIRTRHKEVRTCGVKDRSENKTNRPFRWKRRFLRHGRKSSNYNGLFKIDYSFKKYKWSRLYRSRNRRFKRSVSKERNVETLVVADKMMVGYHGKQELEPYILTVMNIVAKLFHEPSIGNSINMVVTRLIVLTDDQKGLRINHYADGSLESFCKWQAMINPSLEDAIRLGIAHHDNAILMTRYDICTYKNAPCGTLGLAPVAGMCEPERSCSINEDIGLASAFTVSHEVGHNFGMQHDGSGNQCGNPGQDEARIMASQLTKTTNPFEWSSCSREYITGFLDSGRGKCLENEPSQWNIPHSSGRPGRKKNAHLQCKYQYGSKSSHCKYQKTCKELWCVNPITKKCVTNSIPAAEGTTCSTKKYIGWCYRGRCVKEHWRPRAVDGAWGSWSSWGSCSRTCGGGVESSERRCDSPSPQHAGRYCLGERRRYRSCLLSACSLNSTDFRQAQCTSFNSVPFRGRLYKWQPFAGDQVKPCALNCLAVGFNFYTERASKVIDGTRCFQDELDMCINGECKVSLINVGCDVMIVQHVGCDEVLGSDAVEDHCRVCGGDGSSCRVIQGTFEKSLERDSDSYKEVVRVPLGAVHVTIEESTASRNYLALKSARGEYYINGAWTIDWPRKFEVANTIFHYERKTNQPETLTALGPTSEELVVMLLLQEKNHGVRFKYYLPREAEPSGAHRWEFLPWGECSQTCASGRRTSTAVCIKVAARRVVGAEHCSRSLPRPRDKVQNCNEEPCPPRWVISEWSECSATCGGGEKSRHVRCVQQKTQLFTQILPAKSCSSRKPKSVKGCNDRPCPAHWATDAWRACQPACGPGRRTRNVYCVSSSGVYTRPADCASRKKPSSSRSCSNRPCLPASWVTGAWFKCSVKCGTGYTTRVVQCRDAARKRSLACDKRKKPANRQKCAGACLSSRKKRPKSIKGCRDKSQVAYCPLVVKFKFCSRAYFRQMCCATCRRHGL